MSNTYKTARHRAGTQADRDLVKRILGVDARSRDLGPAERHLVMSNAAYASRRPDDAGLRYGNQRRMRAALKVSKRRTDRRVADRSVEID